MIPGKPRIGYLSFLVNSWQGLNHDQAHRMLRAGIVASDRARNAGMKAWLHWQKANPGWQPQDSRQIGPPECLVAVRQAIAMAAPELSKALHESFFEDVQRWLCKLPPQDHFSKSVRRLVRRRLGEAAVTETLKIPQGERNWQAVLNFERVIFMFRDDVLSLPATDIRLAMSFANHTSQRSAPQFADLPPGLVAVSLPIWHPRSGRLPLTPICFLRLQKGTPGNRAILHELAKGEWRILGARLVQEDKGDWSVRLRYRRGPKDIAMDKDRVAELWLNPPTAEKPFAIKTGKKPLQIGDPTVAKFFRRLAERREALKKARGWEHDAIRAEVSILRQRMGETSLARFVEGVVESTIRICRGSTVGTLIYREPHDQARKESWFTERKINFSWLSLVRHLKKETFDAGIELVIEPQGKEMTHGKETPQAS